MINFARWFFLGILIYAPWAYGCTRLWTINLLNYLLWSCGGICVVGWLLERHRPRLPVLPLACLLLVILQTLWMWFNAHAYYDNSYFQFILLSPPVPGLPGSMNKTATLFILRILIGLAVAFIVTSDLVSDSLWRTRLWTTMGLVGGSIILFGLTQRALHAPSIFWLKEDTGITFFGAYRYHANAGAYLNLMWPVLAALTVEAWQQKDRYVSRAFWMGMLLLGIAACFINISRGANGITLLLLLPAVFLFLPFYREHLFLLSTRAGFITVSLFVAFILALVLGGSLYQTQYRWERIEHEINYDYPRFLVQQATARMVPLAGWFGMGAGTFSTMFPYFSGYLGNKIPGYWLYAHEDYLQAAVEFGYIGAALWSVLLFGGLAQAARSSFNRHLRTTDRIKCRASLLALSGVALHSLLDFPLQIYSIQLYVMVFLAYIWTRAGTSVRKREHTSSTYRTREDA